MPSQGGKPVTISASWNSESVYMITQEKHKDGGNLIAKATDKSWQKERMPAGASWYLAVDNNGNPAFTATNNSIWYKRDGKKWINIRSCAETIVFGPDNSLYKLLCQRVKKGSKVLKYNPSTNNWKQLTNQSA